MEESRKLVLPLGIKKAAYSAGVALLFALLDFELFSWVALLCSLFFLYAYRNRVRLSVDRSEIGVLAPVEGRVIAIENIDEDGGYGYRVVIDSSMRHSGVLRVPFATSKRTFKLQRGTRVAKDSHLFLSLNESLEALFENDDKHLKVVHRLKRSPLRIELFDEKNESESAELYGFAYDAITEIYLPYEFRLNIHRGQQLEVSHVIGYFSK